MPKKQKTWVQKLEAGEPLDRFDEIKADADFNHKFRVREAEERKAFEDRKNRGREFLQGSETEEDSDDNNKGKGNK